MAKKNEKSSKKENTTRGRVPDSAVLSAANQFFEAATILKNAIPDSSPQPLRVMAVFSIELYLKALNSQVVEHQITIDKPDADDPDPDEPDPKKPDAKNRRFEGTVLTSKPRQMGDKRTFRSGHKLDELFAELDQREKNTLLSEFARQSSDFGGSSLEEMLERYSKSFVTERYYFESCGDVENPWQEIMQFAAFFNTTVNAINNRQLF